MSEQMLIAYCSPTLAGLKTANMFTCPYHTTTEICQEMQQFNRRLKEKGLQLIPLRFEKNRALVYCYRPQDLEKDLEDETAKQLLLRCGYSVENTHFCVVQLIHRLRKEAGFPHEIGLFLGYPPEDVCGFIEYGPSSAKCVGCWRVYGDAQKAQQKFRQFDKCTKVYGSLWEQGRSLEKLTVCRKIG